MAGLEYIAVAVADWAKQYRHQVLSADLAAVVVYHQVVVVALENVHSDKDLYLDLDDDNVHKRDDVHPEVEVEVLPTDFVHIHLFENVHRDFGGRPGHQGHPADAADVVVDAVVDVDDSAILPLLDHYLAAHMHVELFVAVDHCHYLVRGDHQWAVHRLSLSWAGLDHPEHWHQDHHYRRCFVRQIQQAHQIHSAAQHLHLQLHHPAQRVILFSHSLLL